MNLVLVTETFPPEVNGVAMTLSRLAGELTRRGHRVRVARPRQQGERKSVAAELNGHGNGHARAGWEELTTQGFPIPLYPQHRLGGFAVRKLLGEWRADRPDLVHVATEGPLGLAALTAARLLRIPLISTFHTNFHHYSRHYGLGFMEHSVTAYLRSVHNATRANLVPDPSLIRNLDALGFKNNTHWGRGVDTRLFSPEKRDALLRTAWGATECTPVILHVSRMAAEKNTGVAIAIFRKIQSEIPDAKMVLVGDGPELIRLKRENSDLHFTGTLLGEELARHYASADLFIFASDTETFGNVVTESLASGLIFVGYDYAAARQFVRDGENGFTVPVHDEAALRSAALKATATFNALEPLRKKARETALGIPWEDVVSRYESIAASVI